MFSLWGVLLQLQLSPDVEVRLQAEARAKGLAAENYVSHLVELHLRSVPPVLPQHSGEKQDLPSFFGAMAACSGISQLPEHAFLRESFYRDHD